MLKNKKTFLKADPILFMRHLGAPHVGELVGGERQPHHPHPVVETLQQAEQATVRHKQCHVRVRQDVLLRQPRLDLRKSDYNNLASIIIGKFSKKK